ncbi:DUF4418 family protein [Heliobacterium chlorum]|uniref:DUF4418 family protein n=1 Tax=Heliobacterium chlorum TaxID=2698 RepID=A0ABR7T3X7_HELCL|nr:DUF4418 family protein [Heliobacterium chlorum]MBC9784376.1 DUF4418 family protein [Heliobacterium chlorum]
MESRWRILAYTSILLSAALLVTPKVLPICRDLMITQSSSVVPMRCHYAYQAEFLVSLLALLISGSLLVVKGLEGRRITSLFLVFSGFLVFFIPQKWLIGICGNTAMDCHHTIHWMYGWAGLLILNGFTLTWLAGKNDAYAGDSMVEASS